MTAKTLAVLIGLVFLAVGALGFIDNPIIGESPDAIFHADTTHNAVHLGSGLLFLLVAFMSPNLAAGFMVIFGIVYLAVGVLGLMDNGTSGMGTVLGVLHVNGPDNLLHVGLGLLILICGLAGRKSHAVA